MADINAGMFVIEVGTDVAAGSASLVPMSVQPDNRVVMLMLAVPVKMVPMAVAAFLMLAVVLIAFP